MTDFDSILEFWFDNVSDDTPINRGAAPFNKWFTKNEKFDADIRARFEGYYHKAREGQYKSWEENPRGLLALIILLDQFPRNMYRNTPQMFAADAQALACARRAIREGSDRTLKLIERTFVYLPLEHSEDISMQELSVLQFEKLLEDCQGRCHENAHYFEYNLFFARKHHSIIGKFGRFPHRNTILGRTSTPPELEFLKSPSSAF